jgi:hypothetical protein
MLSDRAICRKETLGMTCGFEPRHPPFPLAGGLVGVFRTIIQIPRLPVFDTRQHLPLGRAIAFQLVGHEHPRHLRQPSEELLGRVLIPAALHQNIEHVAVLIDGPPHIMTLAVDR